MTPNSPLDLRGPDFLLFYGVLYAIALAMSLVMRAVVRRAVTPHGDGSELDPYETAFLAGGGRRVALLGVSNLIDRGALEIRPHEMAVTPEGQHARAAHPVERAVLDARGGLTSADLRQRLVAPCETIRYTLLTAGLLVSDPAVAAWRVLTVIAFGVILAIAAMKVATGVSRDKPVGFLVVAGFATLVTVIVLMRNAPFRSQPGERLLRRLRHARPNRRKASPPGPSPVASIAGLGVALYGLDALAGHPQYRHLQQTMAPTTGGGGSSCSSGCGSSGGDSGGSSCGGGGCGGCGGGGGD
jgi:uncharacterized protein (TIGR04222 family)